MTAAVGYSCWCVSLCHLCRVLYGSIVLGYISRRCKESSHKPRTFADPATVYGEVGSNASSNLMSPIYGTVF